MAKDNIIKFPTSEEMKKKQMAEELQKSADMSAEASTECVAMTQEYLNYIEHIIQDGVLSDWRIFEGMEFRNEAYPESKDMYVLVNLFNAMLNRYLGMPHDLSRELDRLYIKIKKIAETSKQLEESMEQMEVFFDPDFDLDGDDDDS